MDISATMRGGALYDLSNHQPGLLLAPKTAVKLCLATLAAKLCTRGEGGCWKKIFEHLSPSARGKGGGGRNRNKVRRTPDTDAPRERYSSTERQQRFNRASKVEL